MRRHNQRRRGRPEPRIITVKYAGTCRNCGETIAAGKTAEYFPAGSAGENPAYIAHTRNTWDEGQLVSDCHMRKRTPEADAAAAKAVAERAASNAYAGDGLDARYEDDCAERCGR